MVLIDALLTFDRRVAFALSISDRELYVSIGNETLTEVLTRLSRT